MLSRTGPLHQIQIFKIGRRPLKAKEVEDHLEQAYNIL